MSPGAYRYVRPRSEAPTLPSLVVGTDDPDEATVPSMPRPRPPVPVPLEWLDQSLLNEVGL